MRNFRHSLFAALLAVATSGTALANYHTFAIEELYSNSDGTVQYVVLHEVAGMNGENLLQNHTLTSTSAHGSVTKTFTFPNNLPGGSCSYYYGCMPAPTAGRRVLIATQGFAALALVSPDYVIPNLFLPTDGATIVYGEGVSQVIYDTLPTDGTTAMNANGTTTANVARNYAGGNASVPSAPVTNVEFHNGALDHYFNSSLEPDIDALDSGRIAGWTRTGQDFKVYPSQDAGGANASPVCRILIPPPANSHFFSASPQECADTLAKFPFMIKETDAAYFIQLPQTTGPNAGSCPGGTVPVYRVFNNRPDGNHRYTTSTATRDQMVAMGGVAEGYGPDAVIMCAPQ
jgi:hypothetical protein